MLQNMAKRLLLFWILFCHDKDQFFDMAGNGAAQPLDLVEQKRIALCDQVFIFDFFLPVHCDIIFLPDELLDWNFD